MDTETKRSGQGLLDRRRFGEDLSQRYNMINKTRILILGGRFGGVYAALRLDKTLARRADVEVTLLSSNNFPLFTPMLHEVAADDLNPSDIVNPIRRMLKRAPS